MGFWMKGERSKLRVVIAKSKGEFRVQGLIFAVQGLVCLNRNASGTGSSRSNRNWGYAGAVQGVKELGWHGSEAYTLPQTNMETQIALFLKDSSP